MTTPTNRRLGRADIDKYAGAINALPDEAFLGTLVFFSISQPHVKLVDAREHLLQAGVPITGLRKALRPVDAYYKATNDFAMKLNQHERIRSEFLVRPLGDDGEGITRAVVLERAIVNPATGQKRQLFYDEAARLFFTKGVKKKGVYLGHSVEAQRMEGTYADMEPHEQAAFDEAMSRFQDRFDHLLNYMDAHAVRTFVRTCIERLDGTLVKSSGGLYFVAQEHAPVVASLAEWVRSLTNIKGERTCDFYSVPLLNLADQRQMIVEAFEQESVEELERMLKDVKKILDEDGRVIEERTYDAYTERAAELRAKVDTYATMLGDRALTADVMMNSFQQQLMALASRIKGKPTLKITT